MVELHQLDGLCHMLRLSLVQGQGLSAIGVAELAATSTDIAPNHEGGSASPPALADVGTPPTAANGVQTMGIHYLLGVGVSLVGTKVYLQPIWFPQVLHYFFNC